MNISVEPRLDLLNVISRPVPRYTSYPTAPHFSAAVTPEVYAGWLTKVRAASEPVSLYLHIPFCRSICTYCGCTTKAARKDEPLRAYAEALHREIALVADRLGPVEVAHLHWGGGTPNILPADCLEALVDDLRSRFTFLPGMEHAIELDPRHVTAKGAALLTRLGVNRASLGVQTLDETVQTAIGRVQPLETVQAAFTHLRAAGITNINADLMYGLPHQTAADVVRTAREVARLEPSRIALFGYAHVPWMKPHQTLIDETTLPGTAERLAQANAARAKLIECGYVEIGIDHFARPADPLARASRTGTLHRNFQGYTDDNASTLIGLGVSSISRTPDGYAQNAPDQRGWLRSVEAGELPIVRGKAFDADDRLRADVIEDLLCDFASDLDAVAALHGADPAVFDADLAGLTLFMQEGWVTLSGRKLVIRQYRPELARLVASQFDRYLNRAGRHSVAV
jgi:oxygen-independent coproporphyrinogen III oxidase